MYRLFAFVALGAALCAGAAHADTTLTYQGANGAFKVDMRPGAVRIDDAGPQWQLYKEDADAIFSVNPNEQSYTRLDRDAASTIRGQVETLRARIEQRVQQLPPSQRATARAAMLESVPGLDTRDQKVGLERTGRSDTVAGVTCEIVQVVRNGQPAESLCVAGANALGIDAATFATVKSMFSLMQTMLAGTGFEAAGLPYLSLSGMPVRFTDTNTGERRALTDVAHQTLPDARFDVPNDYIENRVPQPGN